MSLPPLPKPDLEGVDYELWGQNAQADCWFEAKMRAYAAEAVEAERKRHMNPEWLADAAMTFAVYNVADENRTAGELIAAMGVIFGNALIDAMIYARRKNETNA